jgi:hypothetical protein
MTANQQWAGFLKKYDRKIIAGTKKALAKMRKLVPGATEMVYDNYNALVIGFGPSEKASLAVFSLALYPDHISLCFLQGAGLPDPGKRLLGSGNVARHVKLIPPDVLDEKEIRELIIVAMNRAKEPIDPKHKRKMVIKSISKKQRPRRH